jgi:hypothetical protein
LRRGRLFLAPGDSPIGLRLPLNSLPYLAPVDYPHLLPADPFAPRRPLLETPPPILARTLVYHHGDAEGPSLAPDLPVPQPMPAWQAMPVSTMPARPVGIPVRTALAIEPRDGKLCVFMPPVERLEDYLELLNAAEATAAELGIPVRAMENAISSSYSISWRASSMRGAWLRRLRRGRRRRRSYKAAGVPNELHDRIHAVPGTEIAEGKRAGAAHAPRVPFPHFEGGADMGREVDLVDDQKIGTRDAGAYQKLGSFRNLPQAPSSSTRTIPAHRPKSQLRNPGFRYLLQFMRNDLEFLQPGRTEVRRNCDVRGVTPTGYDDAADAGMVMPGIEREPAACEKHFEPGAEIHGRRIRLDPDVTEIAGAIAGRDVHATAQRDGKMGEVATHPHV